MAAEGASLVRTGETRERPSLEAQPPSDASPLHRTPEVHETHSGNVELRNDPDHTSKLPHPEQILDPRGSSKASHPEDILAFRRSADEKDTPLE